VSARQIHGRLLAFAAGTSVALAGCASSSIQTDATTFLNEHAVTATRVAAATKAVAVAASRLSSPPSRSQLEQLAHQAAEARRSSVLAGEWNLAKSGEGGEEGVEEEDLPRAETEATEAADELAGAMSALEAYTRAPSVAALARYQSKFAHGREVWDESISEIWHLAHDSSPPIV
jgi:hypothetical protein